MNRFAEFFDRTDHAVWLIVVPAMACFAAYGLIMRGRMLRRFSASAMAGLLAPQYHRARQIVKSILFVSAAALISIALLSPQWGLREVPTQTRQLDILLCLDVSRSMLARDAGMIFHVQKRHKRLRLHVVWPREPVLAMLGCEVSRDLEMAHRKLQAKMHRRP